MLYKYAHPEYFEHLEKPDFHKISGEIILYGAGVNGAIALRELQKQGIEIVCFCDSDKNKWGGKYFGYDIISPDALRKYYPNAPVLVTPYIFRSIRENLDRWGYKSVYDCTFLFLEFDMEGLEEFLPDFFFIEQLPLSMDRYFRKLAEFHGQQTEGHKSLCIVATERCTLRCKECMSFIPYYKNPRDCNWEDLSLALDRLFSLCHFEQVELEGGELFLYNHLARLLKKLTASEKCNVIYPVTTATVIPSAEVLEELKHSSIEVRISNYGKISKCYNVLVDIFEKEGIKYRPVLQPWKHVAEIRYHDRTEDELLEVYRNCCKSDGTPFLVHGKIYTCQFQANTENLGILPCVEEDIINLLQEPFDTENLKRKLNEFYNRKHPLEACKYCYGRGYMAQDVPIAEQWEGPVPPLKGIFS